MNNLRILAKLLLNMTWGSVRVNVGGHVRTVDASQFRRISADFRTIVRAGFFYVHKQTISIAKQTPFLVKSADPSMLCRVGCEAAS